MESLMVVFGVFLLLLVALQAWLNHRSNTTSIELLNSVLKDNRSLTNQLTHLEILHKEQIQDLVQKLAAKSWEQTLPVNNLGSTSEPEPTPMEPELVLMEHGTSMFGEVN